MCAMNPSASQTSGLRTPLMPGVVIRGGLLRRGSGWPPGRPLAASGLGMVVRLRSGWIVLLSKYLIV